MLLWPSEGVQILVQCSLANRLIGAGFQYFFSRRARVAAQPVTNSRHTLDVQHSVAPDGTPTVTCRGHITLETANLFKTEVKNLAPNHKSVLADMSAVSYVDSSGLGAILGTYVSAKSAGCELKLVNVHPYFRDLLNMTHLTAVLEGQ